MSMNQAHWSKGGTDDCEDEHDGREPDCDDEDGGDDEWELGWTDLQARTGRYVLGPGWYYASDGEPSLGSTTSLNQLHWSKGKNDDLEDEHDGREDCCEDEGAQCDDEGEIEHDTMYSDDEMIGYHCFSDSERVAINEIADKLL
jgi:hypothetical protein